MAADEGMATLDLRAAEGGSVGAGRSGSRCGRARGKRTQQLSISLYGFPGATCMHRQRTKPWGVAPNLRRQSRPFDASCYSP